MLWMVRLAQESAAAAVAAPEAMLELLHVRKNKKTHPGQSTAIDTSLLRDSDHGGQELPRWTGRSLVGEDVWLGLRKQGLATDGRRRKRRRGRQFVLQWRKLGKSMPGYPTHPFLERYQVDARHCTRNRVFKLYPAGLPKFQPLTLAPDPLRIHQCACGDYYFDVRSFTTSLAQRPTYIKQAPPVRGLWGLAKAERTGVRLCRGTVVNDLAVRSPEPSTVVGGTERRKSKGDMEYSPGPSPYFAWVTGGKEPGKC
ncbi:hypothetical protein FIBSPDRAFT_887810 [Athelia psychrophila]|uniref:Uncharacterized protein n=1 Tax=Athelia psychrophila TaxID=1759441 RepID=A0A166P924_9AGAM|nr:hypothetical protein FIBSPDRAFT_887810 [Fibularhizoctonia sp. CBS 109695]